MANSKISALTSATTPLAGTETLPIVQSGTTKQVSVANLTAGRAVDTASVSVLSGYPVYLNGASGNTQILHYASVVIDMQVNGTKSFRLYPAGSGTSELRGDWTTTTSSGGNGNFTVLGNLIQGTAAKGVNFTANSAAAGMTSQLLNWYEEGTWTPTVAGSGTAGTYELSANTSCTYQRTGNLVTIVARVYMAAAVTGGGTGSVRISGLPFTMSSSVYGSAFTASTSGIAFTGSYIAGERVTSAATSTLYFYGLDNAGTATQVPIANFTANKVLSFQFSYRV